MLGRAIRSNRGQGLPEHLGGAVVAGGRRGIVDRAVASAHLGERPRIPVGECDCVGVDRVGTGGAGDPADARRRPAAPLCATRRQQRRVHPPGTGCRRPWAGGSASKPTGGVVPGATRPPHRGGGGPTAGPSSGPTPSPTPVPTPSPTGQPGPTPSPAPTPGPTPTPTPTPTRHRPRPRVRSPLPALTLTGPSSVVESTFTGNGSFSDPGGSGWSATVDYGDGTGAALVLNGQQLWAPAHVRRRVHLLDLRHGDECSRRSRATPPRGSPCEARRR